MNLESTAGDRIPFNDPDAMFAGFSKADVIKLAYCAGDFMLALDRSGVIRDIAINVRDYGFASQWIGQKWTDTVTAESKSKVEQLLDPAHAAANVWRQVNHSHGGDDFPASYQVISPQEGDWVIAVGRDLRAISALQQRLLKTQQSMERDYLHLRQTETRYRLLFDTITWPVLIIDANNHDIQQANQSCHSLLNATPGSLEGKGFLALIANDDRDAIIAYLGAVAVSSTVPSASAHLAGRALPVKIAASPFRQAGRQYWLINIDDGSHPAPGREADQYILDVVEKMPDAFVLADEKQSIIVANRAFVELVQAGSVEQLAGAALNRFIGRPDIDLGLLKKQLKDHQNVRNFSSIVNDLNGGEEPVEISAIMIEREQPLYGYSVRSVGRRERDLPQTGDQFPRSVDQLTDLVGRKTLKEIVRESTDLIERMCIEAALVHTSDNRASAAEILGLSRQSLYSKLHRHGLGNLADRD
jgi:transcriptional regulator PpsR